MMERSKVGGNTKWHEFFNFWPLGIALIATLCFGWFAWSLAVEVTVQGDVTATRWAHFLHGRPNEIGDTLSGFVGSMTLIWVVASVIQQSMELRAQRREFVEMVSAQDAQVKALEAQSDIFKDERQRSSEKQEAGAFNNEIRTLLGNVLEIRDEFQISSIENPHISTKIIPNELEVNHTTDGYRKNDANLKEIYKALKAGITTLQSSEINALLQMGPRVVEALEEFGKSLSSLEDFRPRLSYVTKTRVDKLKISETKKLIDLFLEFSENANLNDKTP